MLPQVAVSSRRPFPLPPARSRLLHHLRFPAWLQASCGVSAGRVQGQRLGSCQQPRPAPTRQRQGSAPSFQAGAGDDVTPLASEPQRQAKPYKGRLQLHRLRGGMSGWDGSIALPGCSQEPGGKDRGLSCSDKASHLFCAAGERPRVISCSVQLLSARRLSRPFALQRLQRGRRKEGPNATCSPPDTDK